MDQPLFLERTSWGLWVRSKWWVLILAISFTSSFLFSNVYLQLAAMPSLGIGIGLKSSPVRISEIEPSSPAEQAGLRPGDVISAFNGAAIKTSSDYLAQEQFVSRSKPVTIAVERKGQAVATTISTAGSYFESLNWTNRAAAILWASVGLVEIGLALMLAFGRFGDRTAILASVFIGSLSFLYAPSVGFVPAFRKLPIPLEAAIYPSVVVSLLIPFFAFIFCANFPRPIFQRRVSWTLLCLPALVIYLYLLVFNFSMVFGTRPTWVLESGVGAYFEFLRLPMVAILASYGLGAVAGLIVNYRRCDHLARRRMRLIMIGAMVGLVSVIPTALLHDLVYHDLIERAGGLSMMFAVLRIIFLASFVYAVVKYRVFDIPVLLKRGGRYLLVQRGFLLLLFVVGIGATAGFAHVLSHAAPGQAQYSVPLGALFGIALVWAGNIAHNRVRKQLDRAFFRSAYDVREILEQMGEKSRAASDRSELASILRLHIRQALHPTYMHIYLQRGGGALQLENGASRGSVPEALALELPQLQRLAESRRPMELQPADWSVTELGELAALQPECLVPIVGRKASLQGLLVMGMKMSEEPYAGEDLRLLHLAAAQAGVALENIALAEDIAIKMQAEKLAAHELEIARSVQSKLLPASKPTLASLEFAGHCTQAKKIGGDYYDYIEYAPGKIGFVLADIAGKGISAALLMSNLQASLRSHSLGGPAEIAGMLKSVNALFQKNISMGTFATLFFGFYEDATGMLTFCNCGHVPPIVVRKDGAMEKLEPTATVLGVFADWEGEITQLRLAPGDLLLLYSDGITEALGPNNELFGEDRLLALLRRLMNEPQPQQVLHAIVRAVESFSPLEQNDDITLLVARARSSSAATAG